MFSPDPVFHSVIPALRAILNAAWYASLSVSMGRAEVRRPARRPPLSHAARWPRRLRSLLPGRRSRMTAGVLAHRHGEVDIILNVSACLHSDSLA